MTATEIYKSFLLEIRKFNTSTVDPDEFNRRINIGQRKWLNAKAPLTELTQDIIDDLQMIRVVTDGTMFYGDKLLTWIKPDTDEGLIFSLPMTDDAELPHFGIDTTSITEPIATGVEDKLVEDASEVYPQYFRLLNVHVGLFYASRPTIWSDVVWEPVKVLRSDKRSLLASYYRKPKLGRRYYELIGGKVRIITGDSAKGLAMRLEYLRYPVQIFFDETTAAAHVDCEFQDSQVDEIIAYSVAGYLESIGDPRWKSYVIEKKLSY